VTRLFEDHLSVDAVVAYADGEMGLSPYQRAAAHLSRCAECAAEVAEQTAASQFLRSATWPTMPGSLFDALRSIPVALPATGALPGLVVDSAGRVARDHHSAGLAGPAHSLGRRFRMGAGALVAGMAVSALAIAAASEHPVPPTVHSPEKAQTSRAPAGNPPTVGFLQARTTR